MKLYFTKWSSVILHQFMNEGDSYLFKLKFSTELS